MWVRVPRPPPRKESAIVETGLLKWIHWIATALAILGTTLVALRLPVYGCGLWVLSNPLWVWWAASRKDWATVLLFSVYEVTAIVGFINWTLGSSGG